MALNTGIIVNQVTSTALPLAYSLPVVVFGSTTGGTLQPGVLTKVRTQQEASVVLGATPAPADTLPSAVAVLQRYGCGNVIVCKLAGATPAALATDLLSKLDLLLTAVSQIGEQPRIILFPGFDNDDAAIKKAVAIAATTYSTFIANFPPGKPVGSALTERDAPERLGLKEYRMIVCHGYLKNKENPTTLEPLAVHLAGAMANRAYGQSPLGYGLRGIEGVDVPMNFSLSDENSSCEKLNDVGVVSINTRPDGSWIVWGDRNSAYDADNIPDPLTFLHAVRARDEISALARIRAAQLLGMDSNYTTASLLTESYRSMLADEVSATSIKSYTTVEIDPTKTDYAASTIWHLLAFQVWLPLELIGVSVFLDIGK